jgi:hypothetical protein
LWPEWLLILLCRLRYTQAVTWELDGRIGTARVGHTQLKGFAMLRDRLKHLIAFHAFVEEGYGSLRPDSTPKVVISERAFEAASDRGSDVGGKGI